MMNVKYLISISSWLSRNVPEFIRMQNKGWDGALLATVTIEPNRHPHYLESMKYGLHHNGACFIIDTGLSGSPSCWNWYNGPDCEENNIIEEIFELLVDIKRLMKMGHESSVELFDDELVEIFTEILMDKELV